MSHAIQSIELGNCYSNPGHDQKDPWSDIVETLGQWRSGRVGVGSHLASTKASARYRTKTQVIGLAIRIVERPTVGRVTLSWRDPLGCSYGNQEWYLSCARRSGICALSGLEIRRGDAVYRPRPTRPPALNADAMIREDILDDLHGHTVSDDLVSIA